MEPMTLAEVGLVLVQVSKESAEQLIAEALGGSSEGTEKGEDSPDQGTQTRTNAVSSGSKASASGGAYAFSV
jgi:hypothetical protein